MHEKFNIEMHYKKYLALVGLNEDDMHPIQKKETKQAFYAAFGQCLLLIDHIVDMPNDDAVLAIDNMANQVANHFNTLING